MQTSEFHLVDGTVSRAEVLVTGPQIVAFGIHPDANAPYHRLECSSFDVLR